MPQAEDELLPAVGCLHTMAVLQAYQAELLGDLDEEDSIKSDDIAEIRRATDLSLRATKETAKAIEWSMTALVVTERHVWLTLSQLSDRVSYINHQGVFARAPCTGWHGGSSCGPKGNCSPWRQFSSLGTSIREQTSCRDSGWGPGNGGGGADLQEIWESPVRLVCVSRPHNVPSGSLWLIQLHWGWMPWCRSLCSREFWREFAYGGITFFRHGALYVTLTQSCGSCGCGPWGGTPHIIWSIDRGCWDHPTIQSSRYEKVVCC